MSISILVEPGVNGFRAAAGSPLDLSAEGTPPQPPSRLSDGKSLTA